MYLKKQQQGHLFNGFILLLFFCLLFTAGKLSAQNLTSTSFQIENPTIIFEGGEANSASFKYFSSTGQFVIGEAASTSFLNRLGFLYFPIATSPVVSATAGDTEVDLGWTPSTATFANVTHYEVGISTSSGGVYSYTNVGNVLTHTASGLSNGTTYYFKVRVYADGVLLATSAVASATPAGSPPPPDGGGGGGGSTEDEGDNGVTFSGRAYPLSKVTILKDGQIAASTIAGPDSNFYVELSNLAAGNYNFAVYGTDKNNIRSSTFTFPVELTENITTNVTGIFIAPTISVDKKEVKKGETITIFGQSAPSAEVTVNINSEPEFFVVQPTDTNGVYLLNFDSAQLALGGHTARSKSSIEDSISPFSATVAFKVGLSDVPAEPAGTCPEKGDLNNDCRVNLVDFSIAAFWYKKSLSMSFNAIESEDLNADSKIDLIDFSILAYYWTG